MVIGGYKNVCVKVKVKQRTTSSVKIMTNPVFQGIQVESSSKFFIRSEQERDCDCESSSIKTIEM